jgi:hypothetical protein
MPFRAASSPVRTWLAALLAYEAARLCVRPRGRRMTAAVCRDRNPDLRGSLNSARWVDIHGAFLACVRADLLAVSAQDGDDGPEQVSTLSLLLFRIVAKRSRHEARRLVHQRFQQRRGRVLDAVPGPNFRSTRSCGT